MKVYLEDGEGGNTRLERSVALQEGEWSIADFDFSKRVSLTGVVYLLTLPAEGVRVSVYNRTSERNHGGDPFTYSSECKTDATGKFS